MNQTINVHGTAIVLGETGVLLRGPSGAGKSVLALCLLDRWQVRGLPAFLVADDRVEITPANGHLLLHTPDTIAGLIELRGRGIVQRPFRDGVQLGLIVDLVPELIRMPGAEALRTELLEVTLARAPVPDSRTIGVEHQMLLVAEAINALMVQ
jgi:serine kinase of HPr protein (carbohydrate metabolism regulator)